MATKNAIGTVWIDLRASTKGLHKDLQKGLKRAEKQMTFAIKRISQVGIGLASAASAAAVVAVKAGLESVDALAKTADKLGITTENLQGLQQAAELSGVSVNTMNMALQRMVRRVAEAAQGTGEAKDALKELGINAQQLASLSPDEQFQRIARAFENVANQGDKVRLAMKLFDSEGVALVNTLGLGEDALREITKEMDALGVSISRVDAAAVERANDAILKIKTIIKGIGEQLAVAVAPVLEHMAASFKQSAIEAGGVNKQVEWLVDKTLNFVSAIMNGWHNVKILGGTVRAAIASGGIAVQKFGLIFLNILDKIKAAILVNAKVFQYAFLKALEKFAEGLNLIIQKIPFLSDEIKRSVAGLAEGFGQEAEGVKNEIAALSNTFKRGFTQPITEAQKETLEKMENTWADHVLEVNALLEQANPGDKYVEQIKNARKRIKDELADQTNDLKKDLWPDEISGDYTKGWKVDWDKANDAVIKGFKEVEKENKKVNAGIMMAWNKTQAGVNNAIDRLVDGGKLKFKDLIDSIAKDIIKSQLKSIFTNLFAFPGSGQSGAVFGGGLSGILGAFSGAFGTAGAANVSAGIPASNIGTGAIGSGTGVFAPLSKSQPIINNYNIEAGMTPEQVAQAMRETENRAVQQSSKMITDQISRGGAMTQAFA